ncbi:Chondramide synthase cmdD [Micromonospora noduli]|uniref:non-ribosomal peptide synthetase n=1 Tax=Micromonospora noduli TaxID=709876 RepID=UPI000DC33372|nr:non-ribosomal peptide synthetase [Micromonospora noduli]RAO53885.1 Chondramide synthase cmdD [Micromonospora noduli]
MNASEPIHGDDILAGFPRRLLSWCRWAATAPLCRTLLARSGELDQEALDASLAELVRRHPSLTGGSACAAPADTGVSTKPEQPVVPLTVHRLDRSSDDRRDQDLDRLLDTLSKAQFDLERGPLLRADVIRWGDGQSLLLLSAHAVAADADSMDVLAGELAERYAVLSGEARDDTGPHDHPRDLPTAIPAAVTLEPVDAVDSGAALTALPGPTDIPYDDPPVPDPTYTTSTIILRLSDEQTHALRAAAERASTTLQVLLRAAFAVLVHRWSRDADVIIGTAVRPGPPEGADPVGPYVDDAFVRVKLDGDPIMRELVEQLHRSTEAANTRDYAPFAAALQHLRGAGEEDAVWPFTVRAVHRTASGARQDESTFVPVLGGHEAGASPHPLNLETVEEIGGGLVGHLRYGTDRLRSDTAGRLATQLEVLLTSLPGRLHERISRLPLMSEPERQRVLQDWNRTAVTLPSDQTVTGLFAEQVRVRPDSTAVLFRAEAVTYRELDLRARAVARRLSDMGVRPGAFVGVHARRSIDAVAALLGVLMVGAAYVPLDPDYPAERLAFVMEDCGLDALLTQHDVVLPVHSTVPAVYLEDCRPVGGADDWWPPAGTCAPVSAAYVIYTSGSTGRPKGTVVPHQAVVRLVIGANYAILQPSEVILHQSSLSFDASVLELWGPLLNGATMAIAPHGDGSMQTTVEAIRRHQVTVALLISPQFHLLVDDRVADLRSVRQLLVGGDVVSAEHTRRAVTALPDTRISNVYGPTETTLFATHFPVTNPQDSAHTVPIGRPISNTECYILDKWGEPVPVGTTGEIYVGGLGVAHGYLRRPGLTAQRFVPDPFSGRSGSRLYRTGDLGMYLSDGSIEFFGRADEQVKVRGYRVELGEIETAVNQYAGVGRSCVLAVDEGHTKRLVAFFVPIGGADDALAPALRRHLTDILPAYMIPDQFISLPDLPRTANDKVDREALLHHVVMFDRPAWGKSVVTNPCTPTEAAVLGIWREALESTAKLNVTDKFFEAGGNSLRMFQLFWRLSEIYPGLLELAELFELNTVRSQAAVIDERTSGRVGSADSSQ